jgi:thymidylate synthase (FAD)
LQIVEPTYEILTPKTPEAGMAMLCLMEQAARTCYKSEERATEDGESAKKLVLSLRERGHDAMLEFGTMVVKFTIDRGISHELVRHRLCSFAQESTRWVDYKSVGIQVICPSGIEPGTLEYDFWLHAVGTAESMYYALRETGCKPQVARSVLPTCTKTAVVCQANLREWRHIFKLRTGLTAHPDMRAIMVQLLLEVKTLIPVLFDDL